MFGTTRVDEEPEVDRPEPEDVNESVKTSGPDVSMLPESLSPARDSWSRSRRRLAISSVGAVKE